MNLQQMRDLVRAQLDLDDTDLPDALLDAYFQEGYDRTLELEQRWPFFEMEWQIVFTASTGRATMPVDSAHIEMMIDPSGRSLPRVPGRWAVSNFPPGNTPQGTPVCWSRLNRSLVLLPGPTTDTTMHAVGYRMGSDWISLGAASQCDCDRRLHIPICWYAASLGYAQQEDEVLEQRYLDRYHESVSMARDAIMRPNPLAPKQVGYTHYGPRPGIGGPGSLNLVLPEGAVPVQ